MGDRFYLTLGCAYCGKKNFAFYAPTCEFFDFKCGDEEFDLVDGEVAKIKRSKGGCGRVNFVAADFSVKKVEDVVVDDVRQAIEMSTTSAPTDAALRKWARTSYKALVKRAGLADAR